MFAAAAVYLDSVSDLMESSSVVEHKSKGTIPSKSIRRSSRVARPSAVAAEAALKSRNSVHLVSSSAQSIGAARFFLLPRLSAAKKVVKKEVTAVAAATVVVAVAMAVTRAVTWAVRAAWVSGPDRGLAVQPT